MPDWDKILRQVAAVTAAPIPFLVAVLIVAVLIWWLMNWRYWENYIKLSSGLADSPGPTIKFDGIIECIHELEREFYKNFCEQGTAVGTSQEVDLRNGPVIGEWNRWRDAHRKMVNAYESIKRDIRFGKLHRLKPSRWGQA
jgi:hypothetical protein